MKKLIPIFIVIPFLANYISAQDCVRDSSILGTENYFSPAPWTPDAPLYNLPPACIGEDYLQSITLNVPISITLSGVDLPVSSFSIPTSSGISNYPSGLLYSCDPPNCVFAAGTLGCIQLYKIPDESNAAPDTLDLSFNAVVNTSLGPIPIELPGQVIPGSRLYLPLSPADACGMTSVVDHLYAINSVSVFPNPFSDHTLIEIQCKQAGNYQFEVFDLLGNNLHSETVILNQGYNQITYNGSDLISGTYSFFFRNNDNILICRMVKI